MNDWHIGVVETINENEAPQNFVPCLVSRDEMQNWKNNDPTKWNLLQKIQCDNGSGLDCYDAGQLTFGPTPTGSSIASLDKDGNCMYFNDSKQTNINIGPPDNAGKCTLNVFYCNGHGTCDGAKCNCINGYNNNKSQGSNMCVLSNECPFNPTAKEYGCANDVILGNEDGSKYVNYKLGKCNGSSCTCYDPKDNENTKIGAWENIDGNAGYQQIGVDITSSVAKVVNTIPKCSICALDYQDNPQVYYYKNYPNLNKNTCSNQKNFGCCSGNCMEVKDTNGKGLICGECVCDKHCDSDQFCDNGVCKSRKGGVSGYSGQCAVGGTATFFDSAHCCHGTGVFTCPDNNINCPDSLPFVTD
jgi:hypothetical protein